MVPALYLGSSKTQGAEQVHQLVGGRVCRPRNLTYFFPWESSSPRHSFAADGPMPASQPHTTVQLSPEPRLAQSSNASKGHKDKAGIFWRSQGRFSLCPIRNA